MNLDDNQLGMIEQLCYLDSSVAEKAGASEYHGITKKYEDKTIGEILECFGEQEIENLRKLGDTEIEGACASGKEWAAIIEYLKSNEEISKLKLSNRMANSKGTPLALCFVAGENSSEAVVAFKGTTGGEEWVDNVKGLNVSDTLSQQEALDFIESLKYSEITVTGHSKGSNKAMYVTITSDKVSRCVGYDGQGFSREFMDKYWAEIQQRGSRIKNYSLSTDYVHALMFPVPNSEQIYCYGYGVDNVAQHHSPNSFFQTDAEGNLFLDENGNPKIKITNESESIEMIHNFTTFIMNNGNKQDKELIINYVSKILSMTFGSSASKDEIMDKVLADPDALATIIAYLVKYMEAYDLGTDDIDKLLEALGLNKLNELITITDFDVFGCHVDINLNLANIITYIKNQLTDDNDDWFLQKILKQINLENLNIDLSAFWRKINQKVKKIKVTKGIENYQSKRGEIHDFSSRVYETLMNVNSKVEKAEFTPVLSWSNYAEQEWFSELGIPLAIQGITQYTDNLTNINTGAKKKIDALFEEIARIDTENAGKIQNANAELKMIGSNISNCVFEIGS